ncbi:MAG: hypothetical protein GC201_09725 [Alphaproteobacteria bacterium]|nr:hypothetical protein [Alphaproteobacteria bacterium]
MTDEAIKKNIEESRRKIAIVEEFMKDIEKVGGKIPAPLKTAVDRYLLAIKLGSDGAEAAVEVSEALQSIYQDMYSICRAKAGIVPGQPQTIEQVDEYSICEAQVDRQWKARNVEKVLNWNDDGSWVRRVWDKWSNRLLNFTGFGDSLKKQSNLPKDGGKPINY